MKLSVIFLSILVLCFISVVTCTSDDDDDSAEPTSTPTPTPTVAFTYPHDDGTVWEFTLQNESIMQGMHDYSQVKYSLDGTIDHPTAGTLQKLMYYHFCQTGNAWHLDGRWYLGVTDETVRIYYNNQDDTHDDLLQLPLAVGNQWTSTGFYDTATVVAERQTITTPYGTYENCFQIDYSVNGAIYATLHIPPDVGGLGVLVVVHGENYCDASCTSGTWALSTFGQN